jgi:transcription elongation GreA/GreB family factor
MLLATVSFYVANRLVNYLTFLKSLDKSMQYKRKLIDHLIVELEASYETALSAAKRAHSTATDKANVAENKYDTLALEAAYLAEGQAKRASECHTDLDAIQNLKALDYNLIDAIAVGALVRLIDQHEKSLSLFLAPVSGGLKFVFEQRTIVVITQSSPLGKKLLGKFVDDEFEFGNGQHKKQYLISNIA